jgi:2,4-dienoyl-CoA reductase-like NADH-dependent reductase (Old Yellow Enzyme family)
MSNSVLSGFTPYTIKNLKLKNRFVLVPLDMRMSLFDGTVSQNDIEFHCARSKDVGLDIIGSAFIDDSGNTALGSISISRDEDIEGLTRLSKVIHENQTKSIIQLVHAGRMTNSKNTLGNPVVAPSAIKATYGTVDKPQALSRQAIYKIIDQYENATKRAMAADFDGIEIHGANSFLPQQFVSKLSNQRQDQFGGSLENRLRFIKILIQRLKNTINQFKGNDFVLGYRLSPEEFEDGGLNLKESLVLAKTLETLGVDYISLSIHQFDTQPKTIKTNFSIAEIFRSLLNIPVIVAGEINCFQKINNALRSSDLVGIGRSLIIDPNWIHNIRDGQIIKTKNVVSASDIGVSEQIYKFL